MKFECGPTREEKRAIRCKADRAWRHHWHRWFALMPRRVADGDCRWLEYIERKGITYMGYAACPPGPMYKVEKWRYEYRVLNK